MLTRLPRLFGLELCVDFCGERIVGFLFSSTWPTAVRDGVTFSFPDRYVNGYGDYTAPDFRGRRLARDRFKAGREARQRRGIDPRSIYYINLANLESRAAEVSTPSATPGIVLGYSAYWLAFGRFRFWASAGARRAGAGFGPDGAPTAATEH